MPGLEPLPSGAELCAYYDAVMRQRLLPSGRVTYLPLCDYHEDGTVTSRLARHLVQVRARKAVVDATYTNTKLPSTHPPSFEVSRDVTCISPNALPEIKARTESFTIIGSGKTAMDSVTWLLERIGSSPSVSGGFARASPGCWTGSPGNSGPMRQARP